MDPLLLKMVFPILTILFAGVAIVVFLRIRRTKSERDNGQFKLESWKLEEELQASEPPRSVRAKNISTQKRIYYFMLFIPLALGVFVFYVFGYVTEFNPGHKIWTNTFPVLILPAFTFFLVIASSISIRRTIERDVRLLSTGIALGAKVIEVYRRKNQCSYRLRFAWGGQVYERVILESFSFF